MKTLLLSLSIALLIPGLSSADATLGLYFGLEPGVMAYDPTPFSTFDVYLYIHNADQYVTAVEYQLVTPDDPGHAYFQVSEVSYPDEKSVTLGNPFSGHSITYWPPLNGYVPGYNVICKYTCFTTEPCFGDGGNLANYRILVGPHPDSGELRGTYAPENDFFPIVGLTSILCAEPDAVVEESWGAIKSMYR
jgi:hypothetical protein